MMHEQRRRESLVSSHPIRLDPGNYYCRFGRNSVSLALLGSAVDGPRRSLNRMGLDVEGLLVCAEETASFPARRSVGGVVDSPSGRSSPWRWRVGLLLPYCRRPYPSVVQSRPIPPDSTPLALAPRRRHGCLSLTSTTICPGKARNLAQICLPAELPGRWMASLSRLVKLAP